jgi:2-polyprenyl-6-methoxyphenol hydroxylase-like FAD-dependent oxidoreductase
MTRVVIVGGGVVGLGLGMMLAKDGHDVLQLERDPEPPPDSIDAAWEGWQRRGVAQFRLGHAFLARWRTIVEAELPEVVPALEANGALRINPLLDAPEQFHGGARPGDERYELVTGRRVFVEKVVAELAEETPGLTVRRGAVVTGVLTGASVLPGVPHMTGVRTEDGSEITADVVIDASGRRSALPTWLAGAGARPPFEELEDSGFIYYGRHYRSEDGSVPVPLGAPLQNYGSISSLTLAADNGHWSVLIIARADDGALRRLKDVTTWEKVVRSLPTIAHWVDAQSVEDRIVLMSKIEDRIRHLRLDGRPLATGLLVTGDAWACTNPSLGRGVSIGTMHGVVARDCLRSAEGPAELAESYATATNEVVEPWYQATLAFDRARLDEMGRIVDGVAKGVLPPDYETARAMEAAMLKDPDCFRAMLDVTFVHDLPEDVLSRPGLRDKVAELGGAWRDEPTFGPDRNALVDLMNS